ncbi:MAG: LptA/OstA family protein [Candidatus Binataceae bacterium]
MGVLCTAAFAAITLLLAPLAFAQTDSGSTGAPAGEAIGDSIRSGNGGAPAVPAAAASNTSDLFNGFNSDGDSITVVGGVPSASSSPDAASSAAAASPAEQSAPAAASIPESAPSVVSAPSPEAAPSYAAAPSPEGAPSYAAAPSPEAAPSYAAAPSPEAASSVAAVSVPEAAPSIASAPVVAAIPATSMPPPVVVSAPAAEASIAAIPASEPSTTIVPATPEAAVTPAAVFAPSPALNAVAKSRKAKAAANSEPTQIASVGPSNAQDSGGGFGLQFSNNKQPINIKSDSMSLDYKGNSVLFTGHVRAVQATSHMTSDQLRVNYGQGFKDVKEMIADGNVRISQDTRWATGDHAVLDQTKHTVVLTGSPVVHDGTDQITGRRITVYLDTGKSVVEGAQAVIFPKSSSSPGQTQADNSGSTASRTP